MYVLFPNVGVLGNISQLSELSSFILQYKKGSLFRRTKEPRSVDLTYPPILFMSSFVWEITNLLSAALCRFSFALFSIEDKKIICLHATKFMSYVFRHLAY